MTDEQVADLVAKREAARARKDFAAADALRAEIASLGYVVKDTPLGMTVERAPRFSPVDAATIPNTLTDAATLDVSFHVLYEGFPDDLERFVLGLRDTGDMARAEVVVVDNASDDGDRVHQIVEGFDFARALHLTRATGWASARNAGLKTARGAVIVLADLSIEPTGDVVRPLTDVFADPTVGVAGPFGLVSDDMRDWREDPGPDVDAIEGYLMAIRREALASDLVNERFKWYRNADIDLSFQVRAHGYVARVLPLPVRKHTHRGWTGVDEAERARLSKKNHYVFFDRWKNRTDLLRAHRGVR